MSKRHRIIMAVWAALLVVAAVVFWDRLFPSRTNQEASDKADAAYVDAKPSPGQSNLASATSSLVQLHQSLKAANPGYNGRGKFVEKDGKTVTADLSQTGVADLSPLAGLPLEALDVSQNPVSDLRPLKGMPLHKLGLEGTKVADLSPLAGMPLVELYMNNTPVRDLTPLKGMRLAALNLYETAVEDISPLAGMPLESLWINGTRVKDLSPLGDCPLVSLTAERTPVADLSPLAGCKLERLHIGQSAVADLTPIAKMPLTRLIFTPGRITQGLVVVRNMPTIRELGTTLDGRMPPKQFWALYDEGKLEPAP